MTKYKDLSPEDKKNWEDYIKNPSDVFDKDKSNSINTEKKVDLDLTYMVSHLIKLTKKLKKLFSHVLKKNIKKYYL